jgi:hypothetical protein
VFVPRGKFACTWQPPLRALLEQLVRAAAGLAVARRIADLLELSEDDDGRPVILVDDALDFDADSRVAAHPVDFLAHGRESIEAVLGSIEVQRDWDYVGLSIPGAGQPRDRCQLENFSAFSRRHVVNLHWLERFYPQRSIRLVQRRGVFHPTAESFPLDSGGALAQIEMT